MLKIILAYDNEVAKLGDYFEDCKNDILCFLEEQNIEPIYCDSRKCNQPYIDILVQSFENQPFIFLSYSHGTESALVENETNPYVRTNLNSHLFYNSLFISNACLVAKELGKELIENDVKGFIGFDIKAEVYNDYKNVFIRVDNYFIKLFILQEYDIKTCLRMLIHEYERLIDSWENNFEMDLVRAEFESLKFSLTRLYYKTPAKNINKMHFKNTDET